MYTASSTADDPKAMASAARPARMARAAIHMAEAFDKGSDRDKAAASAARRVYVASGTANDPKATVSATRRACTVRAVVHTAEANGIDDGARNEGSGEDKAKVSAARHAYAYAPSAASDADKAAAVAARCTSAALAARRTAKGSSIDNGAFNEGSDNNKAGVSASRAYPLSKEDEALTLAVRRGRAASAAQRTTGGGDIVDGTSDESSDDDEAGVSAARREYVASAASDNNKAGATIERCARAARAARPSDGRHPRLCHPSGHEATNAAARRSGMTKATRRTGVGKAASKGDNISFREAYSNIHAGDDTNNDAERHGQLHDHAINDNNNYNVKEARVHKSAVGHRAAKKRPYSPQDSSTNNGADEEARATGADEGAPKVAYARGVAAQRGKGYPKSNHEATSEPIGSRTPVKRPTPRPTRAGARQEQTA